MNRRIAGGFAALVVGLLFSSSRGEDWALSVRFPASEKPVALFNRKNFDGWEGNTGEGGTRKYFSIQGSEIVARN